MNQGHERLEQLFTAALEKGSRDERFAFLDSVCGGDSDLRTQVQRLLEAHDRVGSFLDSSPFDSDATVEIRAPREAAGTRIGRYKILQEIGEGGFGTVYMAEQEQPVRRKVALKIIKLGMDTKQVIARFEAERQALALMDHPNIAKVLDAGATETGRPYFVMELVKGIAVTEYCDKNRLTTRERLEMLLPVCHAVQHAHQKGIIHRDLKPNNVLVTLHDPGAPGVPKVIDFGIAKATGQRLTDKTLFTGFREFLGTPEYMSPDQADTCGLDVDTRTDVYSLGVLLYELLTGTTPFDAKSLREASYEEIRRTVREVEPPRPSVRVRAMGAESARSRKSEPEALGRLLRGDLDWIVMKAMEKDRTHRYATAKDLADDIARHLRHEPVLAGPPGTTYKLRKFVRRHRAGVAAGTLMALALLAGLSLATLGLIQANRARSDLEVKRDEADAARRIAQEQRTIAEASAADARKQMVTSATVSRFLQDMLRAVDPSKALGREVTVRYILDEAGTKIGAGSLAEHPEVEASVRMTLGETYEALGLYELAEAHVRAAEAVRSRIHGAEDPGTLQSRAVLARLLRVQGRFAEAESLLRQTADAQRQVLGEAHADTLATLNELALALWGPGRYAEAEPIHRRILEIQEHALGGDHINTLRSMGNLGLVCRALGKPAEARTLLQKALDGTRSALGEEHPATAEAMSRLGLLLEDEHEYEQAETLYRRTYEVDRRILGPDHPRTAVSMNSLLRLLRLRGDEAEPRPLVAERLARLRRAAERPDAGALALHAYAWELLTCEPLDLREPVAALAAAQRATELDGGRDANMLEALAVAYHATGDLERAIEAQRRAIARARVGGPYNREELEGKLVDYLLEKGDVVGAASVSWAGLAGVVAESLIPVTTPGAPLIAQSEALMGEGRFEEAASLLRGCLVARQKALPAGHWLIADTISRLGSAVAAAGKFAEAEPLLLDAYESLHGNSDGRPDREREAVERIVRLYESWNKPDEAAEWRRRLRTAATESNVDAPETAAPSQAPPGP